MGVRTAAWLAMGLAIAGLVLAQDDTTRKQDPDDWLGDPSKKPLEPGKVRETGTVWIKDAQTVMDATLRKLSLEAGTDSATGLLSPDGAFVYVLEKKGLLHKIAVPSFREERDLFIAKDCGAMVLSREGLLVGSDSRELLVVDPGTLAITRRIAANPALILSAPSLSIAFVYGAESGELLVLDVATGKAAATLRVSTLIEGAGGRLRRHAESGELRGFSHPTITPDGRFLLCVDSGSLHRFRIEGTGLRYEEVGAQIGTSTWRVEASPDSKYVAVSIAGASIVSRDQSLAGGRTLIYKTSYLQSPVLATPESCLAFDRAAGQMYGAENQAEVIVANALGVRGKHYGFREGGSTRRILVHPGGWKAFVMTDRAMFWLELPAPAGARK